MACELYKNRWWARFGNSLLFPSIEGIGLRGLGCLFQCQNPRMLCSTQSCCLKPIVSSGYHFSPLHLPPETLTFWDTNGAVPQETGAPGSNPKGSRENLKTPEWRCSLCRQSRKCVGSERRLSEIAGEAVTRTRLALCSNAKWWLDEHFHALLRQCVISLSPVIYADSSNCVLQAHKVKPGCHHTHYFPSRWRNTGYLTKGTWQAVRQVFVRQLWLRGLGC